MTEMTPLRLVRGLIRIAPLLFALLAGVEARATDLLETLRAATPGDVILLPPGPHPALAINGGRLFDPPVTIRSADPARPAILPGLVVRGGGGLIFEDILFDYVPRPGEDEKFIPFRLNETQNIVLRRNVFDGALAAWGRSWTIGKPTAFGFGARGVRGLTLEDNEWRVWARALIISRSVDVVVRGNHVHRIRSDGMDFAQVSGLLIEANYIHAFDGVPDGTDHRDMIQFWTASTAQPTTDVTIRGNLLDAAGGLQTQSIFIRNEVAERDAARREEMLYRDFVIEDNVIRNGHLHGITISNARGVAIRRNTVLRLGDSAFDGGLGTPRINLRGGLEDAEAIDNIVARVTIDNENPPHLSGNVEARRDGPPGPLRYDALFADAGGDEATSGWELPRQRIAGLPAEATPVLRALAAVPGSAAEMVGASLTHDPLLRRGRLTAAPVGPEAAGAARLRILLPDGAGGEAPPAPGSVVRWRLPDGTELERPGQAELVHDFGAPGRWRVTAALHPPGGGEVTEMGLTLSLDDPLLIDLDFLKPDEDVRERADGRIGPEGGLRLRDAPGPGVLSLGRPLSVRGGEAFTLMARLSLKGLPDVGALFTLPGALSLGLGPRSLEADLVLADGGRVSLSAPGALGAGAVHDVTLMFDGADGLAEIRVDGRVVAQRRFAPGSRLNPRSGNDLVLGHPTRTAFGGKLERASLYEGALAPETLQRLMRGGR